jgi:hypothetical protein
MTRTSDIPVLELKKPGDGATLRVIACEKMKVGAFPEVEFIGVDESGKTCAVRISEKAADRQLERGDLTRESVVGETMTFARSPNAQTPSRPFWDVVRADAPIDAPRRVAHVAQSPRPAASAASAPSLAHREQEAVNANGGAKEKSSVLYERITKFAIDRITPLYKDAGIPVTMEGTHAIVATLFIEAKRNH